MKRLFLALAAATPAAAQQFPAEVPDPTPVAAMALPRPQEKLLPNGLRLVVFEDHRAPVVSLVLAFRAGDAFDPAGKEGLADLTASLLTRGAGNRSADSVASLVERLGASFSVVAGADHLTLQYDTPAAHAEAAFDVVANAIQRPELDPADLTARRDERTRALAEGLEGAQSLAGRLFLLASYADHPYGRRPTALSLSGVTREDVRAFLAARARPAGAVLVVAGDITLAKASQLATAQFGAWKGAKPAGLPAMTGPRRVASGTVLVHIPGATEATVLVGGPALAGPDSAFYEAAVLTRLLDDPGAGRLAHAFQAHPAWSGETGASLVRNSGMGIIQLSAAVPGEIADSALLALRAAARQVASTNPAVAELNRAREYVSGTFALRFQTASQLAVGQAESRLMELPASYISTFRPRTMAVTAARVRAVARRLLPDSGLVVVVAGDAVKLYPRLAKLGPIQLIGADGRRLDLQAIQPRSVPFALDMTRYSPRLDSLAIVADGRVVGAQVMTLERAGDTLRFRDRSAVGGATQQVTTVVLDTMGHARRVDLAAAGREGQTKISLSYAPGRVTGRTEYPGANGPRVTTIDQAITAGVIDESALAGILPLLAWELNNRWSFEVFSARENRVQNLTLTVADLTQVTVPAGEFECYRGDLEGGNQRISYYVTRQAPYRIVRIEIAGAPVELVAINR